MVQLSSSRIPPPLKWQDFEDLCHDLWSQIWKDANAQKNGRTGQPQNGVDVFGRLDNGTWVGVQCKGKAGNIRARLKPAELRAEVEKAKRFEPRLAQFIMATTAGRDKDVQEEARRLTQQHETCGLFSVHVWSWDEITAALEEHQAVFRRHYPFLLHPHPGSKILPCLHQLPAPPAAFTGRNTELTELERLINEHGTSGVAITALGGVFHGMGGVGKTALAIALAHRLKHRFAEAQIFVNMRGADSERRSPTTPVECMQRIIRSFHPDAKLPDELDDLQLVYRSVLQQRDGRVLILLDDVASPEQIAPLLPPANCLLLVTSRHQFTLPGLPARPLDCLPPSDSETLLLRLAPRVDQDAPAAAALCGHLPLALEVFAGMVNDRRLYPVTELLERLRTKQERMEKVDAAFEVSFELLPSRPRERWLVLSVFPGSFDQAAAAALWNPRENRHGADWDCGNAPEGDNETREDLQTLLNANLVQWTEQSGRFRLHDLIRSFGEMKLGHAALLDAQLRHAVHFCHVLSGLNRLYLEGGDASIRAVSLLDVEMVNIAAAQAWAASRFLDHRKSRTVRPIRFPLSAQSSSPAFPQSELAAFATEAMGLCVDFPDLGYALLALRLHPQDRVAWLRTGARAALAAGDQLRYSNQLGNLGLARDALGEHRKAIKLLNVCLRVKRSLRDLDGEATALTNLARLYATMCEYRRSLDLFDKALRIRSAIGDERGRGRTLKNLGDTHWYIGEPQTAVKCYELAGKIASKAEDLAALADVSGSLGVAHCGFGDIRRGIDCFQQQLSLARRIGSRHDEAAALMELGTCHCLLGDLPVAKGFLIEALDIVRQLQNRSGEAACLGNLGNVYFESGDLEAAEDCFIQALALGREMRDRGGEARAIMSLGKIYTKRGETSKAIESLQQSLRLSRETGEPREEANAENGLGHAYMRMRQPAVAQLHFERQLAIAREIDDLSGQFLALSGLAVTGSELGDTKLAARRCREALSIAEATGNTDGMVRSLILLGKLAEQAGELHEAISWLEQAFTTARKEDKYARGAMILMELAGTCRRAQELEKAADYYEQCLRLLQDSGEEHMGAGVACELGNIYMEMGEVSKATDYYSLGLRVARTNGDRLAEAQGLGSLGNCAAAANDEATAVGLYEESLAISRSIGDRESELVCLENLARLVEDGGNLPRSIELYDAALTVARELNDKRNEAFIRWMLAHTLRETGDRKRAVREMELAIPILEDMGHPQILDAHAILEDWRRETTDGEGNRPTIPQ
jgi:tetratricopeptide (TPR) repeat protein